MTGQRFELLPQVGGPADTVILVIAAFAILVAVLGVVFVGRAQARRLREESGHAEQVFALVHRDPDEDEIRLSARRKARIDADPEIMQTEGMIAISRTALQEAEIYLQHHRIALKHHSAYQQASLWSGLLGFSVVLVGAALTYFAGLDVGAVTALAGVIPAAAGRLLFRQANIVGDRAAENLRGLEDSVRRFSALQGALAATAEIGDRQTRNRMYEVIGMHMLFPADELETLIENSLQAVENGRQNRPER
jgi:TRADD-N domain-containing protein